MLETRLISPFAVKPTHHLIAAKYFSLEHSGHVNEILNTPIVLFGESFYVYDGHHRIMLARVRKTDNSAYIITSAADFNELQREYWDPELNPERCSYEEVLGILQRASLADDEVFN